MNTKTFLSITLLTLLLLGSVSALGVSPARTTLDYKKNEKHEITVDILNKEQEEKEVTIEVTGALQKWVKLQTNKIRFEEGEEKKTFTYEVKLPNKLEPGIQETKIIIKETPTQGETSKANVQATIAVATQLHIHVPATGKSAKTQMKILNDDTDGSVLFVFPTIANGEYNLESVYAVIDIKNLNEETIDTITTPNIQIPVREKRELVYRWKKNVPIGRYKAKAILVYDEETKELEEQEFKVGEQKVELQDIKVQNFQLGEIAKFEMIVENKWSEPILNAYIQTLIYDNNNNTIGEFKSSNNNIEPLTKNVFTAFWDTKGFRTGTYNTEIIIHYLEKQVNKKLQFEIQENNLNIIGLGYVITNKENTKNNNTTITLLTIGIITLILTNILWFLILRKKIKKNTNKNKKKQKN